MAMSKEQIQEMARRHKWIKPPIPMYTLEEAEVILNRMPKVQAAIEKTVREQESDPRVEGLLKLYLLPGIRNGETEDEILNGWEEFSYWALL